MKKKRYIFGAIQVNKKYKGRLASEANVPGAKGKKPVNPKDR